MEKILQGKYLCNHHFLANIETFPMCLPTYMLGDLPSSIELFETLLSDEDNMRDNRQTAVLYTNMATAELGEYN